MNKLFKTLCTVGLLSTAALKAEAIPEYLSGSVYEKVGISENIDPVLLYAVSLTESALAKKGSKDLAPSVYVIRTPKGAIYPKSLPEAKNALERAINRYSYNEIDVGLMQINGQHWKKLKNKGSLFNPTFNVTYGARILKSALRSTDDRVVGIGRYHSYTDWRAKTYGNRVIAIYNNLLNLQ